MTVPVQRSTKCTKCFEVWDNGDEQLNLLNNKENCRTNRLITWDIIYVSYFVNSFNFLKIDRNDDSQVFNFLEGIVKCSTYG